MAQATVDERRLKKILKEAVSEAFAENKNMLREILSEALEDFALAKAMRESEGSGFVSHEEVMRALGRVARPRNVRRKL